MPEFIAFSVAAIITYLLTLPMIRFAQTLSLVTDPNKRNHPAHTHSGTVPRGGGLPIYTGILITSLFFVQMNQIMYGILVASFFLVILGLFDDRAHISPYLRFFCNIAIAAIAIGFGLGIPYVSNPFGGFFHLDQWRFTFDFIGTHSVLVISDILAIIWLVWTTNTVNWSKGVDGQLPGFVAITAVSLGLLSQRFTAHDISAQQVELFAFVVAGAFAGFLPWNFYPQRIMPGYGGGGLAGFLLGILGILSFGKIGTAILILAIPTIDAVYTILRRIKKKQSPFHADWGHFHHRLLEIGWGRRRIAVFYWTVSAILGVVSLYLNGVEKIIAFVTIGLALIAFIALLNQLKAKQAK